MIFQEDREFERAFQSLVAIIILRSESPASRFEISIDGRTGHLRIALLLPDGGGKLPCNIGVARDKNGMMQGRGALHPVIDSAWRRSRYVGKVALNPFLIDQ